VLAWRGSEGCDSQVRLDEKEKEDVVGRTKGYGIFGEKDADSTGGVGH
jgi:hypothetical protein